MELQDAMVTGLSARIAKRRSAEKLRKRRMRADPIKRSAEQIRNTSERRISRADPTRRGYEQEINTAARRIARANATRKSIEQKRNSDVRKLARENIERRLVEQFQDTEAHRRRRSISVQRAIEQANNTASRRERRTCQSFDEAMVQFSCASKEAPVYACTCCGGLWFRESVKPFNGEQISEKYSLEFLSLIESLPSSQSWICSTCLKYSQQGRVPRLAISNGLMFPPVPVPLQDLSQLEERLCAARIPFMQIRALGIDRQCGLKGNIVNIWNPVNESIKILPRKFSESSTVQLAFMRRLTYKNPYMFETIRPAKVYKAAKYLITTPLYQEEGISLSDEWSERIESEEENFIVENGEIADDDLFENQFDEAAVSSLDSSSETIVHSTESESDCISQTHGESAYESDSTCSSENSYHSLSKELRQEEEQPGEQETLYHREEVFQGIRYAPGQGQSPMSLIFDGNAELLSFPTIYCGQPRNLNPNIKLTYSEISKSEARRFDRRGCTPPHILYQYKLQQIIRIHSAVNISLRKKKVGHATAGQMRNRGHVDDLIQHDDGFRCLKGIRSSPAHWEEEQKKVMAMIRQVHLPTVFLTLSAAEVQWPDLIIALVKIHDRRDITENELTSMSWVEKSEYIRKDPITCAQYFDHRFKAFLSKMLKSRAIFDDHKLLDYYVRVEFQHRGSPHVHCLLWLSNAPKYITGDENNEKSIVEFIDRYITCKKGADSKFQQHRHSFTCRRSTRQGNFCRFGVPIPPMDKTTILIPHNLKTEKAAHKLGQDAFKRIKEKLEKTLKNKGTSISFNQFLSTVHLNRDQYINALRSSIKRPTVFLKREVRDAATNAYNVRIAKSWKANMDMQFILDPFGCAKYVAAYINKASGGISKLLRKAAEEIRDGNVRLRDKLWKIGNCFLNGVEVSAQEAAYGVLGLPMTFCSRSCVFINTSPAEERVYFLKSTEALEKLEESSTDIVEKGLLDHYVNRPESAPFDEMCLAVFAAWYTYTRSLSKRAGVEDQETIDVNETDDCESNSFKLLKQDGYVRKRRLARIIRYRKYSKQIDPENYYREQCMLYMPWRNEASDILSKKFEELYFQNSEVIANARREFDPDRSSEILDEAQAAAAQELNEVDDFPVNNDAEVDEEYQSFFDDDTAVDIFGDVNTQDKSIHEKFSVPFLLSDDEYMRLTRSLNAGQRAYFNHAICHIKEGRSGLYNFVSGGAGFGKTHLIKALVQAIHRHEVSKAGRNPSLPSVLLCAPTGRAAFHIRGLTLHSAFSLPLSQCKTLSPLDASKRNSLYCQLQQVKMIIIDEISMCSARQLAFIDSRLRDIFGNSMPFANINIVVFGDFWQLRPVGGTPVYLPLPDDEGQIMGPTLWRKFRFYELVEIMRQRDDLLYAAALNNIPLGKLTDEQIQLFKSRETGPHLKPPQEALRLFGTNAELDIYNDQFLNNLASEGCNAEAVDLIQGSAGASTKAALMEVVKSLAQKKTQGLARTVLLKIEGKYMVTLNVDVQDGIVNGTIGTLKTIVYGTKADGNRRPVKLLFAFDEPDVGKNARTTQQQQHQYVQLSVVKREIYKWPGKHLAVIRIQFPITPAHAITYHKSQGGTYQCIVVRIRPRITRQELYVSLSRVTSLDGLYIDGEFHPPKPPPENDPVILEMRRLRGEARLEVHENHPEANVTANYKKVIFHNVQSFNAHKADIIADETFMRSALLLFVESWTINSDDTDLEGFDCVERIDCPESRRKPFGLLAFSKPICQPLSRQCWTKTYKGSHTELSLLDHGQSFIIFFYKSPRYPVSDFLQLLDEPLRGNHDRRGIVVGDLNVDLKSTGDNVINFFKEFGYWLALSRDTCSTDAGTLIDVCFTNDYSVRAHFRESTFSHHRPMVIQIQR